MYKKKKTLLIHHNKTIYKVKTMTKFKEHKTQYGFKQETNNHAEHIIRNDIIVNHTALINDLMHEKGWLEETSNLYLSDEALKEQYAVEYADFLRELLDESETLDEASHTQEMEATDKLRDWAQDNNCDTQEPLEWWQVTQYLYEKLRNIGEPVLDTEYGYFWGRTCSGQHILLDGTIQKIVKGL
jgi:hypothetical protein